MKKNYCYVLFITFHDKNNQKIIFLTLENNSGIKGY